VVAKPPERTADEGLNGDDPALAPADALRVDGVDDGRPEELEGVGVRGEGEEADLGVRKAGAEEVGDGAKGETDGDALEKICAQDVGTLRSSSSGRRT
jgi:hypothetical protein